MIFNLCTNLNNGAGLERDYRTLRALLEERGHFVRGINFEAKERVPNADVNIFMEVLMPTHGFAAARENWFFPNCEWYFPEAWDRYLPQLSLVLCKTKDCLRLWREKLAPEKCVFTGFEARDVFDPTVERVPWFLHVAGKSQTKNTVTVIEAWRRHRLPYPLTVVARRPEIRCEATGVPGITLHDWLEDKALAALMNHHLFHLMPSRYEGFGHYIHEALGCGGLVLTTDAPPMNGFAGIALELLIPPASASPMRIAMAHDVTPEAIATAVRRAAELPGVRVAEISQEARSAFLADRAEFRKSFDRVLEGIAPGVSA